MTRTRLLALATAATMVAVAGPLQAQPTPQDGEPPPCGTTERRVSSSSSTASGPAIGPLADDPRAGLAVPLWVPGEKPSADRRLCFESIPRFFKRAQVQLSGGRAVIRTREWRSVAISTNSSQVPCTVTLIGPRVALLAAHCVDAGHDADVPGTSTIPAEVVFDRERYALRCEMSPTYRASVVNPLGSPRATDDFALCDVEHSDPRRSPLDEVSPETIATSLTLAAQARIQLMGYGCTKMGLSDDGRHTYTPADGTLNMGHDSVNATGISIYPGVAGIWVRTLSSDGGPVLCFGDSGGPVMTSAPAGPGRRVVAVNSGVGATSTATAAKPAFYSYFAPLASNQFRAFIQGWASQLGVPAARRKDRRICGVALAAGVGGCKP